MKVHQFYTHSKLRNFSYVLECEEYLLAIDPWEGKQSQAIIEPLKKPLKAIINTHEHWDHFQGNAYLVELHTCEVWAHENARKAIGHLDKSFNGGEEVQLDSQTKMKVLYTPGHTMAHLCFLVESKTGSFLFSGDTLFNAGVGNCHNGGDPEILFETIRDQVMTLNDDTIVYPGHDYLINNLSFTMEYEPTNSKAKEILDRYKSAPWKEGEWVSTISQEKEINTFLRYDQSSVLESEDIKTQKQKFLKLRELRNQW